MSSFSDKDRFSHKNSRYERPTLNYRCGRAQMWGKPCDRGPDAEGGCRGMAECRPVRKDDRWQCRRRSGACEQGPLPDGSCCSTQPPCSPVPSGRLYRRRTVVFGLLLAVATLCALVVYSELNSRDASASPVESKTDVVEGLSIELAEGSVEQADGSLAQADGSLEKADGSLAPEAGQMFDASGVSIISPGGLSDLHSAFTNDDGCESCHVPAETHEGSGLLASIGLSSLSNHKELSAGCVSCHTFGGPAKSPHNLADSTRQLECQSCHTEHEGRFATLTKISNEQCAACHEQDFASFKNHPAFDDHFPYLTAGSIVFDHQKHLKFHFEKAKNQDAVPETCTSCHNPEGAKSRVKVAGFDSSCSGCHESNINDSSKAELALLSLPGIKLKDEEAIAAYAACGAEQGKRFKGSGKGRSNPFTDWLLGYRLKQGDEYSAAFCGLLQDLEAKGLSALLAKFKQRSGMDGGLLFNGLTPELVSVLTQEWIKDERYRPSGDAMPADFVQSGWIVNKKGELNYRPIEHADRVALEWLEFATKLRKVKSDDELATRLADSILSNDGGLGACMKCHLPSQDSSNEQSEDAGPVDFALWSEQKQENHHRFKFNHSAHLRFVGAGSVGLSESGVGCALCHEFNPDSKYLDSIEAIGAGNNEVGYESNFHALKKETCSQCHNEQSIKDDCTLCHVYHESPGFTPKLNISLGGKL